MMYSEITKNTISLLEEGLLDDYQLSDYAKKSGIPSFIYYVFLKKKRD